MSAVLALPLVEWFGDVLAVDFSLLAVELIEIPIGRKWVYIPESRRDSHAQPKRRRRCALPQHCKTPAFPCLDPEAFRS
jgi:hypothetical protein